MRRVTRALPVLSWMLVLALAAVLFGELGHPVTSLARLAAYWGWVVVAPGLVLHRWLRPGERSWSAEVAWGGAVGLSAELVLRPLAIVTGWSGVFWLWPLAVLVAAGAIPALRHRTFGAAPTRDDVRASVATAAATGAAVAALWIVYLRAHPVPRQGGNYYQDLMFHLSLVRNLQLEAWPSTPQVAGVDLDYHWFADSHVASVGLATGLEPSALLFHLWLLPVIVLTSVALAALARQCTGVWWTGPALVWFSMACFSTASVQDTLPAIVGSSVIGLSPSQMFLMPLFLGALSFLVDFVRGRRDPGVWAGFALLALATSGAKPTALPLLAAGIVFTVGIEYLRTRRLDRTLLALGAASAALFVVTQGALVGSTGGSGIALLSPLRALPVYDATTGDTSGAGSGGWLMPAFDTASGAGFAVLVLLAFLLVHTAHLVGLFALAVPDLRADAGASLLCGITVAAWAAFLVLDHPGVSQAYFLYTALPLAVLLTLWLVPALRVSWRDVGLGVGLGLVTGLLIVLAASRVATGPGHVLLGQVGVCAGVVAAGVWLGMRGRRTPSAGGRPARLLTGTAVAGVAVLAMAVPLWVSALVDEQRQVSAATSAPAEHGHVYLSAAQIAAARRLDDLAEPDDVVATNVHCLGAVRGRVCDARAFWVSALSGQRILLEGWAYTAESQSQQPPDEASYTTAPTPWPARLDLSDRAVSEADPRTLDRLRRQGVRWIFADRHASRVSGALDASARLTFRNDAVSIYELVPASAASGSAAPR